MSAKSFDEVLAEAKQLSRAEQARLIAELSRPKRTVEAPPDDSDVPPRSLLDVMLEHGLVGFMDGPPDLSTNPKYLKGLGRDAG